MRVSVPISLKIVPMATFRPSRSDTSYSVSFVLRKPKGKVTECGVWTIGWIRHSLGFHRTETNGRYALIVRRRFIKMDAKTFEGSSE
jgi:hypothetical protein